MNTLIIILIFGSLLLLSFLLLTNPLKVNEKANFWFGLMMLVWSTFWLEELFILMSLDVKSNQFWLPIQIFQFFTPILFYYGITYYVNPNFKFNKRDALYFIFPLILVIVLIAKQSQKNNTILPIVLNFLVIFQGMYFIILSYKKIKRHKNRIHLFSSNTIEIDLKWIELIIYATFILVVFIGSYNLIFVGTHLNLFANIIFLLIIYFIAYHTLKQKEIFLLDEKQLNLILSSEEELAMKNRKIISDNDLIPLKNRLIKLMNEQKPYLDSELSLSQLAELMNLTPHHLSYLINTGFKENFFWFVNRYRTERVKELLLDEQNNNKSILGIAFESGFNSKTSFNTTFKKICQQTPSEFKKSGTTL
jgi:AraC-like DNA-binding protein